MSQKEAKRAQTLDMLKEDKISQQEATVLGTYHGFQQAGRGIDIAGGVVTRK